MRKSRLRQKRNAQESQDIEPEANPYANELEVPAKTKLYAKIFVGALILITAGVFFSTDMLNKQNDKSLLARIVEEDKINQAADREKAIVTNVAEIQELKIKADSAYQASDYFATVFFYRQVLTIDEADIEIHQKLIEALKVSCKNGYDLHCDAIEKAQKRLEAVENE
ncbi:MAG: hypothetical protein ACI85O_000442 [Saprospiraceae bacterium]|jgi:hypothetical protein